MIDVQEPGEVTINAYNDIDYGYPALSSTNYYDILAESANHIDDDPPTQPTVIQEDHTPSNLLVTTSHPPQQVQKKVHWEDTQLQRRRRKRFRARDRRRGRKIDREEDPTMCQQEVDITRKRIQHHLNHHRNLPKVY